MEAREKIAVLTQVLSYWLARLVLLAFAHYRVYGAENLTGLKGPIVFAANHASFADGPISGAALPLTTGEWYPRRFFPVRWLAYEGYFRLRYLPFAFYLWLNDCVKIRKEPRGNLPIILKEAVDVLRRGGIIWIYPEGRRSRDGRTKRARRGVAYFQEETRAPVIPVGIWGNFGFFSWKTFFGRKYIRVRFGAPLYRLEGETLQDRADFVVKKISELRR